MLSKRSRLTAAEVRSVIKNGRSLRSPTLSAKYVAGSTSKAAVVVSTKVAKKAVERNRLRRAAYQALATALPPNAHVVFFLHKPLVDPAEFATLCSKLS